MSGQMSRLPLIVCTVLILSIAARAHTGNGAAGLRPQSTRAAVTIERYEYRPDRDIPLTIYYSDGSTSPITPECGRFARNDGCVSQSDFTDIQVSDDRQRIGWAAHYMMCAQSYPCPMDVSVLPVGKARRYFHGDSGTVWRWSFWKGGSQVILQCGFPHGDDTGYFVLFDSDTGRVIRNYTPGRSTPPDWVVYLQNKRNK
jgi:hypothetical protein